VIKAVARRLSDLFDSYNSNLWNRFQALGVDLTAGHALAEALAYHTSNKPLFGFTKRHREYDPRFQRHLKMDERSASIERRSSIESGPSLSRDWLRRGGYPAAACRRHVGASKFRCRPAASGRGSSTVRKCVDRVCPNCRPARQRKS
jgi:hypothetical protein